MQFFSLILLRICEPALYDDIPYSFIVFVGKGFWCVVRRKIIYVRKSCVDAGRRRRRTVPDITQVKLNIFSK